MQYTSFFSYNRLLAISLLKGSLEYLYLLPDEKIRFVPHVVCLPSVSAVVVNAFETWINLILIFTRNPSAAKRDTAAKKN